METVSRLLKNAEKSVIMATHSPNQALYLEAQGLCVKAAIMDNGKIAVSGIPSEVLTRENLCGYYGIEAKIMHDNENKNLYQIVPLCTLGKGREYI